MKKESADTVLLGTLLQNLHLSLTVVPKIRKGRSETERGQSSHFRARPWKADDFVKPLEVHRQMKPLTEVQAFHLHCDRRASERAVWKDERKQKEQAKMEALALREKE
eukprot:EG_transcript_46761